MAHAAAGNVAAADAACVVLLSKAPNHAEAWHMRGTFALYGWPENPPDAGLAVRYFESAIRLDPKQAKFFHGLGLALRSTDDIMGALEALRRAITLKHDFAEAIFEIAAIHEEQGKLELAATAYLEALVYRPGFLEAHHNLSGVYRRLGQPDESLAQASMALALAHDNPVVRFSMAISLEQTGNFEDAITNYQEALRLRPNYVQAEVNLGHLFETLGRIDDAIDLLERGLIRHPEDPNLRSNLGNAYLQKGRATAARKMLSRAIELAPNAAPAYNSLAVAHMLEGNQEGAISAYRHAIEIHPEFAEAHENLAQALLAVGQWDEGWQEYEWRWRNPANALTERDVPAPLWDGKDLNGQVLLLHAEQGLGDTIQMIRFAPHINKRGGRIILACQSALTRLLVGVSGIDEVITLADQTQASDWPTCDCQAPLFSLPRIFGCTRETIPAKTPYIPPPKEDTVQLSRSDGRAKIAITWAGRPKHAGDPYRDRSCPFEHFSALAVTGGATFYSLQRGNPANVPLGESGIVDLGGTALDFADDATVLSNMDLVISTDTALAHLAGAMNVPCWLALPYTADWRWADTPDVTIWYPSLRLFRQPAPGDWTGVFDAIAEALDKFSNT